MNKCVGVGCIGKCSEPKNHQCVKKSGCCETNDDCDASYACNTSMNKCLRVLCPCGTIENHVCKKESGCCSTDSDCSGTQVCKNNKCQPDCTKCQSGYTDMRGRTCPRGTHMQYGLSCADRMVDGQESKYPQCAKCVSSGTGGGGGGGGGGGDNYLRYKYNTGMDDRFL